MTQQSRPQFVEHSPLAPAATAYPIRNVGFGSRLCENVFPPAKTARNRGRSASTRRSEHIFAVSGLESILARPRAALSDLNGQTMRTPLTVAKFDRAVDLLAEARQLLAQLIEVHTKLFPDDQKIFEVEAMVETSVEKIEAYRDRLHPN